MGATYVDGGVVRDGNLITSRQPDDLPAFLRTIIEALQARPTTSSHGRKQTTKLTTTRTT